MAPTKEDYRALEALVMHVYRKTHNPKVMCILEKVDENYRKAKETA